MLPDKLFTNIDELIALSERKVTLLRDLKKALMLAEMIGVPPKDIKGKMRTSITHYGTPLYAKPWRKEEFVVHRDGVEVCRKKLIDVPHEFWPADVLAEYQRHLRRVATKVNKE